MNVLQQQILEDLETLPEALQAEILDFVQFLKAKMARNAQQSPVPNGDAIARLCEQIAARNTMPSIPDPSAWQREIRKDRPLPGRDD
ncbi:DUF2281 domain-containing protein [Thiothrix nivea]|uniref:DUF2281 domain-containing protein n=1 Tax=Thiothrix nivea (strain ATCC 35100 / DSM 5205 / JP2) TaxID=870187 RepID=A0A656HIT6_THINJ|nr:DUF2281 domain-containing protein [Thiothrix nivea]EIJ35406.1 hypothetical protein Thini_2875 [Thiothrix nivea DSM 5205]